MRLKFASSLPTILVYASVILLVYFFVFKAFLPKFRKKTMDFSGKPDILDDLNLDCQNLINFNSTTNGSLKIDFRSIEDKLLYSKNRCSTLKAMFRFPEAPYSDEEAEFPLAYGMLVYKELGQVLFMLSSFYHPQNEYCLAVGENSDTLFQKLLHELSTCFHNVHFMKRPPISWGSHEIINSAYGCLEFLSHLKSDWRYFQYLSGVDAPLKTNLEMVRIMKALNGSANVEIKEYQAGRLRGKNITNSPLTLFKSSLSALISREAANFMASSLIPRELLEFLENTGIADEGFWGTLFGNRDKFNVPGAVNASEWIEMRKGLSSKSSETKMRYYISRDQVWNKKECGNYMTSGSCVFGYRDVGRLLKSDALVAHKFYLNSQPAAYFCILKEIRKRSEHPQDDFVNIKKYSELPQVELKRGKKLSEVMHPEWIL
uniref:Uncharacterized protein n=2 Tax=Caenorhabditis japonica TaxID=281687 RepID=A0A8R1DHQ8_CAEJA